MLCARAPLLVSLAFFGCTGAKPALSPRAANVTLSEQAPPAGYVPVQVLSVQSGKGCGLLAERGSRTDADGKLRVAAEKLGASYVHVTGRREPQVNHQCLEHEFQVSGVAYRPPTPAAPVASAAPPAPPPSAPASPAPASPAAAVPTLPHVLLDFEGEATLGKPARSTERSSVALSLASGESGGTALSVDYRCSGGEPQALLEVWFELGRVDLRSAKVLSLRVKPGAALALRVSFTNGEPARWTQHSAPLSPNVWQTVTLRLDEFRNDRSGAPVELSALGLSPKDCADGHLLLDDLRLE
jgi:hypothetical protein